MTLCDQRDGSYGAAADRLDGLGDLGDAGALIDLVTGYNVASRMYRIWGELTDWVDFQESNELIARAEIVRAAREWLALDSTNNAAVNRYLNYWEYDVCGFERPSKCGGGATPSV